MHIDSPRRDRFDDIMNIIMSFLVIIAIFFAGQWYIQHDDPHYNSVRFINNNTCVVASPKGVEPCSSYTKEQLDQFPIRWEDYKKALMRR